MGENDLPDWMTHNSAVLCREDLQKVNRADNYGHITCLLLIQKFLTEVRVEEMYNYLE